MVLKLVYFASYGRGECIRFIFKQAGEEFEEERFEFTEFANHKSRFLFGQVPVIYLEDGTEIAQTVAICRYLGKRFGLAGANDVEDAKIDMYVDAAKDLWDGLVPCIMAKFMQQDDQKYEELKKKFLEGSFKNLCTRFEGFLKGDWLVGSKPTWGDAYVAEFLKRVELTVDKDCLSGHPKVKAWVERYHALPNIAKYMAERPSWPV